MKILICEDSEAKFHQIGMCISSHSPDHTIAWCPTYDKAKEALEDDDTFDLGIFDNNMQMSEYNLHIIKDCGIMLADRNRKTRACKKVFILTGDPIPQENIASLNRYGIGDIEHLEYSVFDTTWCDHLIHYLQKDETCPRGILSEGIIEHAHIMQSRVKGWPEWKRQTFEIPSYGSKDEK